MKLTVSELLEIEGYETAEELASELIDASSIPAMCSEGCYIEPDGYCSHGHPSFFLELGII